MPGDSSVGPLVNDCVRAGITTFLSVPHRNDSPKAEGILHCVAQGAGWIDMVSHHNLQAGCDRGSHAEEAVTMDPTATTHTGPLGSTIHVLRADAGTVAELAAIDWSRSFSRVCLDPVFDEGKVARYGEMGVRKLWRLHGRKGSRDLRVDFLALRPGTAPQLLAVSDILGALTPGDVREAVDDLRLGLTHEERTAAVARIVRRRQRTSVRVREE